MIRCYVAYAIGEIAAAHTVKSDIQAVIPFLGELASDKDLEVQQMAFKALSRIQSPAVLPYLEKGLLSTFGSIKQLANAAIQKLKLQYGDVATATEYPPALQKPSDQA
jgi:HEAT repeat protein